MQHPARSLAFHRMAEPNLTYGAPGTLYAASERLRSNVSGFRPQHRQLPPVLRRPVIAN